MMNQATRDFIRNHASDDVRRLALQGAKDPEVDLPFALDQIAGRQKAKAKLPSWAAIDDIVYPPHLAMEQCSSEPTARYKASLAGTGQRLIDLTGGFGVDFAFMSQGFREAVYVERQPQLCAISSENFSLLGLHQAEVVCADSADYLDTIGEDLPSPPADLIYIDPARRDEHGARTYGLADCTPNVLTLLPLLLTKTARLLLKLSPMLDWRKAVSDLGPQRVAAVHIVSVDNECKELLVEVGNGWTRTDTDEQEGVCVVCVNLLSDGTTQRFEFRANVMTSTGVSPYNTHTEASPYMPSHFSFLLPPSSFLEKPSSFLEKPSSFLENTLLIPNASLMKAGCFAELSAHFGITQIETNSHLFVSPLPVNGFPGRQFQILRTTSLNKRELREALSGITRANIAVRNFPLSADALRRRLKLQDGGDTYIFATTLSDGSHRLFICQK